MSGQDSSKDGRVDEASSPAPAIQPHIPPSYNEPSTSTSPSKDGNIKPSRPPMRGQALGLTRTHSRRELYDADTASTYGEFGSYTSRGFDGKEGRKRSRSNLQSRPSSRDSNVKPRDHKGVAQYVSEDAKEKEEEEEVLEDVKRGHSGESVREKKNVNADLEKQQPQQTEKESGTSTSSTRRGSDTSTSEEKDPDPNLVTWDSPDSMENPRNWSLHRRWSVILIVSSYTFLSPLSSSMIAPALPTISNEFHITSSVEESLMLSVFVLAYAIGPLFLAPLSEMFGRKIILQTANIFFIIFTVACAVAQNRIQLSIFRFFAGLGGSAPLTIGGGTVSDLMLPEERGVAMSIYSLGPLLGPALGPIIGGWIIQENGNWRWIFGVASIAAGVTASIGIFILPETYAPKILGNKAAKLRKETGNDKLHTVFDQNAMTWQSRMRHNLERPFILAIPTL